MDEKQAEASPSTGSESGVERFKKEFAEFIRLLGNAVSVTVQGMTDRVWVPIDDDSRRRLDLLVDSGAANNRAEAAAYLVREGIKASEEVFERIENANEQIGTLLTDLRASGSAKEG